MQRIDKMSIDSCEAAQLAIGSLWSQTDMASQHLCKSLGDLNSGFADRVAARNDCGSGGSTKGTLAAASAEM